MPPRLPQALKEQGFRLVSGGTDNHLMLLDFSGTEMTGKVAEEALDKAGITVNKNTVPFETRSPFVTSGIRIGTPAATSHGLKENEMKEVAVLIAETLANCGNEAKLAEIKAARQSAHEAVSLVRTPAEVVVVPTAEHEKGISLRCLFSYRRHRRICPVWDGISS